MAARHAPASETPGPRSPTSVIVGAVFVRSIHAPACVSPTIFTPVAIGSRWCGGRACRCALRAVGWVCTARHRSSGGVERLIPSLGHPHRPEHTTRAGNRSARAATCRNAADITAARHTFRRGTRPQRRDAPSRSGHRGSGHPRSNHAGICSPHGNRVRVHSAELSHCG